MAAVSSGFDNKRSVSTCSSNLSTLFVRCDACLTVRTFKLACLIVRSLEFVRCNVCLAVCSFGCVRCDACLVVRYFTFVRCSAYLVFPTLGCVRYKYVTRLVRQFALSAVQCLFGRSLFQIRRYSVVYVWLHAPLAVPDAMTVWLQRCITAVESDAMSVWLCALKGQFNA